jgi:hypothetical protein
MEYVRFLSFYIQSFYFISDFLLGPSLPETIMFPHKPTANKTVIKLERNLTDQIA